MSTNLAFSDKKPYLVAALYRRGERGFRVSAVE
jgi:hypothetical protein